MPPLAPQVPTGLIGRQAGRLAGWQAGSQMDEIIHTQEEMDVP